MFIKWIVTIRRDVGKHFNVTEHTRVCSRCFKPEEIVTAIAGRKWFLLPTAVPFRFPWKKGSAVKLKAPTKKEVQLREKSQRIERKQHRQMQMFPHAILA